MNELRAKQVRQTNIYNDHQQFHLVRTLVSAGELSLSCTRLLAGWVTTLWLRHPLSVSQHGQLSLPSLQGWLMSSNPCYNGLWRQTAEGVVRGVAYRPRQQVLLAARLECRLAAGSRPRNGDERRSLALWAVSQTIDNADFAFDNCKSLQYFED